MRKSNFKFILSVVVLYSMTLAATAKAAPVQFNQVVQVVNAKPGKANTGSFAQLRLTGDDPAANGGDDDDKKKNAAQTPQQDNRVITETNTEIVEDDVCDCVAPAVAGDGFPYGWLALGAVPLLFLIPNDDNPPSGSTPTPTPPTTATPTPTPPTEPVPEPMTILLFGTGLAGIGLAARRRFGSKDKENKD